MRKIKILYIIPSLGSGGTEKHLHQLVKYLNKDRFEIFVICLSDYHNSYVYHKSLEEIGVQVHYFSMSHKVNIFRIIRLINKNNINIVHSLSYSAIIHDMVFYLFSCAEKFITVRRNMQHHRGISKKLKWFEVIRNYFTNLILANSYEAKKHTCLLEGINEKKIQVIYNGIEVQTNYNNEIINNLEKKINYKEGDFVISNIANIKTVKRQEDLIKLISLLKTENLKYKLILIGREDNGYGEIIRNLISELKVERQVYILPYIENVENILAVSTVMIMPSSAEGFSNAILEAYKCNTPVIATNIGGNKEIVDDKLLYDVGDVAGLRKIVLNLDSVKFKDEKVNIHNKIKKFNLDKMIKEYENIYEKFAQ